MRQVQPACRDREAAMLFLVVIVMVVGSDVLLSPTHALNVWRDTHDYIDYAIMKSCFGPDVAFALEKATFDIGKMCEDNVQNTLSSVFQPIETPLPTRTRRSILKLSDDASLDIIMCNLQGLNLVKPNYKMNYNTVPQLIQDSKLDQKMKSDLTEKAALCRQHQEEIQELFTQNNKTTPIDGLITGSAYIGCLVHEGLGVCKKHEQQHYASVFK
ncbi:uncharacterized protein [Procambarus clarkii]|uniref:uncharacterized protein isoform X1 n=2 Tax=Procambarus clarkii TaxID=6728 RepID=UPI0037432A78